MTCVMNTPDLPRYIHDALHYNANITLMVILQLIVQMTVKKLSIQRAISDTPA
jgi:hypothetical protein